MARSKPPHQARIGKRVFNLQDTASEPYTLTTVDIRYWFIIINNLLFDGALPAFRRIHLKRLKSWGYCLGLTSEKRGKKRYSEIFMNLEYPNFTTFFSILAHEMVHHFEWINTGSMSHGPAFFQWRTKMRKIFIPLRKSY